MFLFAVDCWSFHSIFAYFSPSWWQYGPTDGQIHQTFGTPVMNTLHLPYCRPNRTFLNKILQKIHGRIMVFYRQCNVSPVCIKGLSPKDSIKASILWYWENPCLALAIKVNSWTTWQNNAFWRTRIPNQIMDILNKMNWMIWSKLSSI